jgi:hypothetical protein
MGLVSRDDGWRMPDWLWERGQNAIERAEDPSRTVWRPLSDGSADVGAGRQNGSESLSALCASGTTWLATTPAASGIDCGDDAETTRARR